MKYEIDFIGINKEGKDADAICFRYFDDNDNKYHIGVYDGGTNDYGIEMKEHIKKYYKQENEKIVIDFVICSHSDLDHASGLTEILTEFEVKKVYINLPWLYLDELYEIVKDGRITKNSLEDRLREAYKYVNDIEKICIEKNIPIEESFEGTIIDDKFKILSPSKDFYIDLLAESNKTPETEKESFERMILNKARKILNSIRETWDTEYLREDVSTSSENEMSIILYGDMEEQKFLFVGDAGIRAINKSIEYMKKENIDCKKIDVYQIPHHGGRRNVSTSLLNKLLGNKVSQGIEDGRIAIALASKNSDHPKKMVTNAYKRRGIKVFETKGITICHSHKTPTRLGWNSTQTVDFYYEVEDWED